MSPVRFSGAVLLVTCGLLIAACTSTGRSYVESSMQETLDVEILPNTSKMFVYRLRWPQDEQGNNVHIARNSSFGGGGEGGGGRGGVDINRSSEQRLRENAGYVVQNMGYCREGFLVIDSSMSRFHLWLKGECKEGATAEDRKKFGEKQTLPVKLTR